MFANGIGVRQLATRIELYEAANEARSSEVVPGMPLMDEAPGAPAVLPPIAAGQVCTGAGGGGAGEEDGDGEDDGDEVPDGPPVVFVLPPELEPSCDAVAVSAADPEPV